MTIQANLHVQYKEIIRSIAGLDGLFDVDKLTEILTGEWIDTYYEMCEHNPSIIEFQDNGFYFIFDHASSTSDFAEDRLVAAYGRSNGNAEKRDSNRIQRFLGGRLDIPGKGIFDKGHALAHSLGGGLDANLFPQRPELNRGRSPSGRIYRKMEKYAAANPGTFAFSRLLYNDNSWVPTSLEYGLSLNNQDIWVEWFEN